MEKPNLTKKLLNIFVCVSNFSDSKFLKTIMVIKIRRIIDMAK
jgi:hypothetical protein